MTRFWRLWCEFFSLRQKRIPKSNWETATHRKTVQVLAMEHISYNKTFDSLSGFKETFENEDCAYVISAQQIRRSNSIYKSYSSFRRQFTLINLRMFFDYCTRNIEGMRNVKASVFDRKLLHIAQIQTSAIDR